MWERLTDNQVKYDAHIKTMEDALAASRREFESVRTLLRQVRLGCGGSGGLSCPV